MLSRYGMTGCKPISIPLEHNVKLSAKKGELLEDVTVYRCIVGSVDMASSTRADIDGGPPG